MPRCKAKTKSGRRCKNNSQLDNSYCAIHVDTFDPTRSILTGIGVGVGHAIAPGLGGALVGGIVGSLIGMVDDMAKTKVFVSFDFDNDRKLKDFIVGQSKLPDSPFDISDHSLKEAAPEHNWEEKADRAIARSDIVIVMVGPYTHKAHGVLKEVRMARARDKRIVQVIGYKDGNYTAVPNAGRLYSWNWDNLKKLLG